MTDLLADAETPEPVAPGREPLPTFDESGDNLTIDYHGPYLGTKDEFLAQCGIDLAIWEIERIVANGWEVTGKKKQDGEDRIWKSANKQIKVWLKRKAPKFIQEGIEALLADWRPEPLPPLNRGASSGEEFMLELALHDAHFGKLCWAMQTGTDYDLKIAAATYGNAVDDLLRRVEPFNVRKIIMPIGSDFFQVDNWHGTTSNGTIVERSDDRQSKVFTVGCQAIERVIRRCREIADVEFFYLGGNHDRATSWHLSYVLNRIFESDPHIAIDHDPADRKFYRYGPALIGFAHGDEINVDRDLALLMPVEAEHLWAGSTHRQWHTGHRHKRKRVKTLTDTVNGVEIVTLPSLCGTDGWHHRKGFVGNVRAAEAYLWSSEEGYAGHFSVNARSN